MRAQKYSHAFMFLRSLDMLDERKIEAYTPTYFHLYTQLYSCAYVRCDSITMEASRMYWCIGHNRLMIMVARASRYPPVSRYQ